MYTPAFNRKMIAKIEALGFHAFEREGSSGTVTVFVSAEHGDDAADYWGEYHPHGLWINPRLEALAKSVGGFWEWENPGCIGLWGAA